MNVLSLFDGCSCGMVALKRAGIYVDYYFASEIDKYAIQISKKNHPEIIQLGDINNYNSWNLPKIDLIVGGSPCQGFSFAGKQLAFDDPRSQLFFKFVECINKFKPKYFLLENVKMKKQYQDAISDLLGIQTVEINSALVSAQNRKRLYWCNWKVTQPEDKGILLKDILEIGGEGAIKSHGVYKPKESKSQCLDANYFKGVDNHGQRTMIQVGSAININCHDSRKRVYSEEGKSPTLLSASGGHHHIKIRSKSKTIRSGGRGSIDRHECDSLDNNHYRKLTPIECERLQTLPDNYTEGVSNTQRYKMLGNGWTVDVITHILKEMIK